MTPAGSSQQIADRCLLEGQAERSSLSTKACSASTCAVTSREIPKVPTICPSRLARAAWLSTPTRQDGRRRSLAQPWPPCVAGPDDPLFVGKSSAGVLVAETGRSPSCRSSRRSCDPVPGQEEPGTNQDEPAVQVLGRNTRSSGLANRFPCTCSLGRDGPVARSTLRAAPSPPLRLAQPSALYRRMPPSPEETADVRP